MSPRAILAATLVTLVSAAPAAAETIDLDRGWHFWLQTGAAPERPEWLRADPTETQSVDVPHSWSVGRGAEADGIGWYARTLILPAALAGQHAELHFDAVFYKARVWVNGVPAGAHEGGHTGFDIDVSRLLHAGANRILVAADERPGFATIPGYAMRLKASGNVWYDWWRGGGITRDVSLRIADTGLIRRQTIRQTLTPGRATATDRVAVESVDGRTHRFRLHATLTNPHGRAVDSVDRDVTAVPGAPAFADVALTARDPELWQIGDGRLYRVAVTLADETGRAIDTHEDAIGFRTIAVRDRRLWVNGVAVRLTGVSRHQDSPWEGAAETRGTILKDFRDLAALHVTLTRPIHYPQPQAVFDAADRAGMLLIPEIPVWQMSAAQLGDPRLLALAKRMTAEVVAESGNHPSIMAWSVMNECDSSSPKGTAYVAAMKAHLNAIDPGRLVTFADSDVSVRPAPRTPALSMADFVMANAYFGTWSGAASGVGPWLDAFDRTYPDKLLVISEFGWPGPFSANSADADVSRTANLRDQMAAFAARPFVGGAIFWDYQDYRSNKNLFPGLTDGYVDHGLVDADRQRRPSFFAWEERNRPVSATIGWQVGASGLTGFAATVRGPAIGALPSYPLAGLHYHWRAMNADRVLLGEGDAALPDLAPGGGTTVLGHWPAAAGTVTVTLDVTTAEGARAGGAVETYLPFKAGSAIYPPAP